MIHKQFAPFALVGASATAIYLLIISWLVSYVGVRPLVANVIAYIISFFVSFIGNKHLTFAKLGGNKTLRLPYFLAIYALGGMLNEGLFFLFLHYTTLHYLYALMIVMGIVAVFTFLGAKYWACR